MAYSAEEVDNLIAQAKAEIEEYVQSAIYLKQKDDGITPVRTPQLLLEEVGNTETIGTGDGGSVIIDDTNYVFIYSGVIVINEDGVFVDDLSGQLLPFDTVNVYKDERYLYCFTKKEVEDGQEVMFSIKSENNQGGNTGDGDNTGGENSGGGGEGGGDNTGGEDTPTYNEVIRANDTGMNEIFINRSQPTPSAEHNVLWIKPLGDSELEDSDDSITTVYIQADQPTTDGKRVFWIKPNE